MEVLKYKNIEYLCSMIYYYVNRIPLFLLSGVAITLLLILTLLPADGLPKVQLFPHADKVVHALMFGLVAVAVFWDRSRIRSKASLRTYFITGLSITLLGGIIEILQNALDIGRSGDVADWLADAAGAFLLPLLLWKPLTQSVTAYICSVRLLRKPGAADLAFVKRVYTESFPPEERRDWLQLSRMLCDTTSDVSLLMIYSHSRRIGFITLWRLGDILYIEHFATDSSKRGGGLGARALNTILARTSTPVVLEVEPAHVSNAARRRIAFYERNGFTALDHFHYVQPPYSPDLPAVNLLLMSTDATVVAASVSATLHKRVYGVAD